MPRRWAGSTRSSSPAASARTRRRCAGASATGWNSWVCSSTTTATSRRTCRPRRAADPGLWSQSARHRHRDCRAVDDRARDGGGTGAAGAGGAAPIPVAVSARHVHLSRAAVDALFGRRLPADAGRYRCASPASGPRASASRWRARRAGSNASPSSARSGQRTQIEISRTDGFALGIDAPVRDSGKLDGNANGDAHGPGRQHRHRRADHRRPAHPHQSGRCRAARPRGRRLCRRQHRRRGSRPDLRQDAGPGRRQLGHRDAHRYRRGQRRQASRRQGPANWFTSEPMTAFLADIRGPTTHK